MSNGNSRSNENERHGNGGFLKKVNLMVTTSTRTSKTKREELDSRKNENESHTGMPNKISVLSEQQILQHGGSLKSGDKMVGTIRPISNSEKLDSLFPKRSENEGYNTTQTKTGIPNEITVLSEQQFLRHGGNEISLKSFILTAVDELDNRPKNGAIYDSLPILTTIKERLNFLSNKDGKLSIDEAIEIYDASVLLKLLGKQEQEIELAGSMAHSGALLMLQARMLENKGRELIAWSKVQLKLSGLGQND